MRQLALTPKRLRGIPRRIRALQRWSEAFEGYFPQNMDLRDGYWNSKIPVILSLVQGRHTNRDIQARCAQALIDAAYRILQTRQPSDPPCRVTACIVLPDMFSSELCLYTDESYFRVHTQPGQSIFGTIEPIQGRSLAQAWGLTLPPGFSELGVIRHDTDDDGEPYNSENWYFGEVDQPAD